MKKTALILAALMALSLTACASSGNTTAQSSQNGTAVSTHIYVLTSTEDHGWTGSVATFAKEKIAEVNEEGSYSAELITSANAAEQITNIEDILSKGADGYAIVIQPIDDTVQSAIQQIADAGIPYTAFDRIIEGVQDSAVSNVKGDNEGIGAACAAYFVSLGMKPGDRVYVYEGDTSSVTNLRDAGFIKYLTGELAYEGQLIDEADKWSAEDLDSIDYSGSMNWSRSDTKTNFESLMSDASNADIRWFYGQDDEFAMGIIEALEGGGISDSIKERIYACAPVVSGCGGLDEFYAVMRGETHQEVAGHMGGLVSVTYSPAMIQTAIQDMLDYLNGGSVVQDHVIACENVTPENVTKYPSF